MGYLFLNTDDEGFNLKRSCELNEWDERVGFNEFSLDFFLLLLHLHVCTSTIVTQVLHLTLQHQTNRQKQRSTCLTTWNGKT